MNRIAHDFSQAAAEYDAHADIQQHVMRKAAGRLQSAVGADELTLDLGCGTGALARYIQNPLIGCDIAQGMCAQVDYPAICTNAESLPIINQYFKSIFSSFTLQWVLDKKAAFAEMYRVCEPGGKAIITGLGPHTLKELETMAIPRITFEDETHYTQQAQEAGWRIVYRETEMIAWEYENVLHLLRQIKAIGARHKSEKGVLRKSDMMAPITATWEVITLELERPIT